MLWKLLKYDLRSMWKAFFGLWLAVLLAALFFHSNLILLAIPVYFVLQVAMFTLSVVYVVRRFSEGLLGGEGYLLHTLPVKAWELVASKLICAVLTIALNILVALLSKLLLTRLPEWTAQLWPTITRYLDHPDALLWPLGEVLLIAAFLTFLVTTAYQAMAIGHLFSQFREVISILAYLGLNYLFCLIYRTKWFDAAMRWLSVLIETLDLSRAPNLLHHTLSTGPQLPVWLMLGMLVIPSALFFWGTCYILEHKLNLE